MQRYASRNPEYLPSAFYNLRADLPSLPRPPLHPATKEPLTPSDMEPLFSKGFIAHETALAAAVPIPEEVLAALRVFRPTPLVYAAGLKARLQTPSHIFYKYEGVGPSGSHKSNTAIPQAYLAAKEGVKTLTTETGAGQWGSALAHAGSLFGVEVKVFMVRASYRQKPGRRILMELFGGSVRESPSVETAAGRAFFDKNPDHPGSLGIAISEAVEAAVTHPGTKYSLGSVMDAVLMHQTVIGQEAELQMAEFGLEPDVVIGCVGGGSNFGGLAFPFIRKNLREGRKTRFLAVEPDACPTMTKGELRYDHGDTAGMAPLMHMHTLGKDFIPPPIHAGGLRYHGVSPLISHLITLGLVEPRAVPQHEVFDAGKLFLQSEGILPAPESSHAICAAISEALKDRETGKGRVILFNLSGHGFLDISAFNGSGMGHPPSA